VDLFWQHWVPIGIDRNDTSTWTDLKWPGDTTTGIVFDQGIGQSEFCWYARGLPAVKQLYSTIWSGEQKLLVSIDGCGAFRPPELSDSYKTHGGWYHVDQNGYAKPGKHCVQGLLNYFESGEQDGGLVLFPKSHKIFDCMFKERKDICGPLCGDFITLRAASNIWDNNIMNNPNWTPPIKVCLSSGDFVCWDSRTIHCNTPATPRSTPPPAPIQLRRLVSYICMTPLKSAKNPAVVVKQRIAAYHKRITTTHWPHEYRPSSACDTPFKLPKMSDAQKELIAGDASLVDDPQ